MGADTDFPEDRDGLPESIEEQFDILKVAYLEEIKARTAAERLAAGHRDNYLRLGKLYDRVVEERDTMRDALESVILESPSEYLPKVTAALSTKEPRDE